MTDTVTSYSCYLTKDGTYMVSLNCDDGDGVDAEFLTFEEAREWLWHATDRKPMGD